MTIKKPFHRNYRKIKKGANSEYSDWAYIVDHDYAKDPEHYTRAFSIIQSDLLKLFEFIEPSYKNKSTYSFRIHELLIRTCIEIEANFKAILHENKFTPEFKRGSKEGELRPDNKWNINDFKLVNKTHHLDDYSVEFPFWKGKDNVRKPFLEWKDKPTLTWYDDYNQSKHNRLDKFQVAKFENLILAFSGLFVLLSSQFKTESFSTGGQSLGISTASYYKGEFGLGGFLMIKFPNDWKEEEMYDFDWSTLESKQNRFDKIDYNKM